MNQSQLSALIIKAVENIEMGNGNPYILSLSTGKSGLSFGRMQNDLGSGNAVAVSYFTQIINSQVGIVDGLTQAQANSIIALAQQPGDNLSSQQLSMANHQRIGVRVEFSRAAA